MKKRFISLCLTLALTAAPAGAAFSDISSGSLQQTASILGSLGIMQGTGNNRFEPNRPLTRAEFCKLAVTAMGIDDASPYASYTIFPDVHASHWAARYVNAALRHPDFKDNYIIRGYADGTFRPDEYITRADVIKIMNNMLNRHVDANGLNEKATQWSDNPEGTSYYYDILEATNSHNFERSAGEAIEKWTELVSKTLIVDKTFAE